MALSPTSSHGGSGAVKPGLLSCEFASGTNGGLPVALSWNTRVLNTESDPAAIVTLAANQFTLAAGSYLIEALAEVWGNLHTKLRLRDITSAASVLFGMRAYASAEVTLSLTGRLVVTAATVYELQNYSEASTGDYNFGQAVSQGTEVYAVVKITQEAS